MRLTACVAPIEEWTDAFQVGRVVQIKLLLSAIHIYSPRHSALQADIKWRQGDRTSPDLTFLQSQISRCSIVRTDEGLISGDQSRTWIDDPLPITIGFRNLQQHTNNIPTEVDQPISVIGTLQAIQFDTRELLATVVDICYRDLDPGSDSFGAIRSTNRWHEGEVDISNLSGGSMVWVVLDVDETKNPSSLH